MHQLSSGDTWGTFGMLRLGGNPEEEEDEKSFDHLGNLPAILKCVVFVTTFVSPTP